MSVQTQLGEVNPLILVGVLDKGERFHGEGTGVGEICPALGGEGECGSNLFRQQRLGQGEVRMVLEGLREGEVAMVQFAVQTL